MGDGIDAELLVTGKRGSCPSPFLRELGYIKLLVRAYYVNLSGYMKEGVDGQRDRGKVTAYTSPPSKMVSKVAACTSVQRSKGRSFSNRSAESLPRATKSAKRTSESAVFSVDEGFISGPLVGVDEPSIGEEDVVVAGRVLAAIAAPRRKDGRPRPLAVCRLGGFGDVVCINSEGNI